MPDSISIEGVNHFETDLFRASQALELSMGDIMRKVVMDVLRGAVMRTPIDTGALAGNWQVTEGASPETRAIAGVTGDTGAALARAMGEILSVGFDSPFSTWWVANPLPYAPVVEFGLFGDGPKTSGGYSLKAPAGMLRVALAEAEAFLDDAIERALKGRGL